jgi:hypothetical protein
MTGWKDHEATLNGLSKKPGQNIAVLQNSVTGADVDSKIIELKLQILRHPPTP